MSIQKNTVLPNGVSGNWWVAGQVYVSPSLDGVQATLNLYQSHNAWVSGAPALDQRTYELNGVNNPVGKGKVTNLIELALVAKNSDFVSGSVL